MYSLICKQILGNLIKKANINVQLDAQAGIG